MVKSTKDPKDRWLTPTTASVGLLVIGLLTFFTVAVVRMYTKFHSETEVLTFERDAGTDSIPTVNVDQVFTFDRMTSLRNGNGLTVLLRVKNDPKHGYETSVDTFRIPRWKKNYEQSKGERGDYLDQKQQEFKQHLAAFLGRTPKEYVVEVYVDDSDGVDSTLAMQVRDGLEDLNVANLINKGDGVKMYFGRISETDYLDRRRVVVPQGSKADDYAGRINEARDWLLRIRPATKETSLATGLFNALSENAGLKNRTILIFSDGLENTPEKTASFYRRPDLVRDEGKWPQTDSLLTKFLPVTDLTGAHVEWYGPQTGRNDVLIRAALRYWQHLLLESGKAGDVKTHY